MRLHRTGVREARAWLPPGLSQGLAPLHDLHWNEPRGQLCAESWNRRWSWVPETDGQENKPRPSVQR